MIGAGLSTSGLVDRFGAPVLAMFPLRWYGLYMSAIAPARPQPHKFTVDDVLRMVEAGILPEKARVTLRRGELIDMPAEGALHSDVKSALIQSVAARVAGRYRIGADTPLRLSEHDWPEPDLFVLPPTIRPSEARGPDVLLLIEVAHTSLKDDLGENAALYARHGVREYWVIDLREQKIHQHRLGADGRYPAPSTVEVDALAVSVEAPEVRVRLADLL